MVGRIALVVALLIAVAAPPATALEPLPDGGRRPVVVDARLSRPTAQDPFLSASLLVDAHDADGIVAYEYRWNRATVGTIRRTDARSPTVSYEDTAPSTRYALEVRAVDGRGWRSAWFPAWQGITPGPPTITVLGDSVASGYRKRWFSGRTVCRDERLAYGSTLVDRLAEELPAPWRPRLVNLAWPGASLSAILGGGTDPCGERHDGQVAEALTRLDPASWNVVVVTAGINSTNWADVMAGVTRDTALSISERGDAAACRRAVAERWDLDTAAAGIERDADRIVTRLVEGSNARVVWTSYYGVEGSRLAPLWTPVGAECAAAMELALDDLHVALRRGIARRALWVELGPARVSTQPWAGWPHPDAAGHRAIGQLLADAVLRGSRRPASASVP